MATNTNCPCDHRAGQRNPRGNAARGADDGQRALDKRQQQRKDQREITKFWNHGQGNGLGMRKGLQGQWFELGTICLIPAFGHTCTICY